MISRPLLWFIGIALLGVLAIAWWGSRYPAQLTIINTSGTMLENVAVASGEQQFTIGHIANGEFRRFSLSPGAPVSITSGKDHWQSADRITPGQSLVVYVLPGPHIESRSKLGTLTR